MTGTTLYEIQVQEQIDDHWSPWFDGLTLCQGPGNTTLLYGPVVDQAALFGLLDKTRDLGLTLLSVRRVERKATHQPPSRR